MERTVKDVVPALKTNSEGLKKVLEDLVKQYNTKQLEMEKWKVRHPFLIGGGRRQAADGLLYRRRTISRLSSSNGVSARGEFWGGSGGHRIHIAFPSLQSKRERVPFHAPGIAMVTRASTQSSHTYQLRRVRGAREKKICLIARLCTTSLAAYTIQRAGIDVCCTGSRIGRTVLRRRFQRLEAQRARPPRLFHVLMPYH